MAISLIRKRTRANANVREECVGELKIQVLNLFLFKVGAKEEN